MIIQDIINEIERFAPLAYQESYDNCGLIVGQKTQRFASALLALDCTEDVINEAIENNCNLIITHHPVIFTGLKKINGDNSTERIIIKAIQNNIAIYAAHTNIDNVKLGVNNKLANKLGLNNLQILAPKSNFLKKIVTFVPKSHYQEVLQALFNAGAGCIGNYDSCSFSCEGSGTFKGNSSTQPFVGNSGELTVEEELRIETIFEFNKEKEIISALLNSHPYEEVAYDVFSLSNKHQQIGSGLIGQLENEMSELEFLTHVKEKLSSRCLRHTQKAGKMIKRVAICGGSGRFLLDQAINSGADAFITSDFKYHDFFDVENKLLLIDAGHFETEQFTPEIFYEIIQNKFPTFAIRLSKTNTNPINYF